MVLGPGGGSHWLSNCCPQASLRPHSSTALTTDGPHAGPSVPALQGSLPDKGVLPHAPGHTTESLCAPSRSRGAPAHPHHTPAALTKPQGLSKPQKGEGGTAVLPLPGRPVLTGAHHPSRAYGGLQLAGPSPSCRLTCCTSSAGSSGSPLLQLARRVEQQARTWRVNPDPQDRFELSILKRPPEAAEHRVRSRWSCRSSARGCSA